MKKAFILILIVIVFFTNPVGAKTIKNYIIFLAYGKEKEPLIILIETIRQETSIKGKTDTSINIKYLNHNKLIQLYSDKFISDTAVDRFGFNKNFLIKIHEQNRIDIGTSGLSYNFNIITLDQKKRATYQKSINNINYKYYINTAFSSEDGTPIKGNLLFLEAESQLEKFNMPEIIYMMDNLHRSWFLAKFSKDTRSVLFSDAAEFFRISNKYNEASRGISIDREKGIQYDKSIFVNLRELKHRLEINSTSDLEDLDLQNKKRGRIFIFSEGYVYIKNSVSSIFGIRIVNKE